MTKIKKEESSQCSSEKEDSLTSPPRVEDLKQEKQNISQNLGAKYQLAQSYDTNRLVLQVKNPKCVHVYWEYTAEKLNEVAAQANCTADEAFLILRLYDLTAKEMKYYDINITLDHDNWYIYDLNPEHIYEVKLGVLDKEDKFHSMLESNRVETPANSVSEELAEEWMIVDEKMEKIYKLSGVQEVTGDYSSLNNIQQRKRKLQKLQIKTGYSSLEVLESSTEMIN